MVDYPLIRFSLDLNQKSRMKLEYVTDFKSVPFQDRQCESR